MDIIYSKNVYALLNRGVGSSSNIESQIELLQAYVMAHYGWNNYGCYRPSWYMNNVSQPYIHCNKLIMGKALKREKCIVL